MIAWVVEAAAAARRIDAVWVATDDRRIARAAEQAGARVAMTSPECASGTDRVAQAAREVPADVYVNVQGDEPLVDPGDVDALVEAFVRDPSVRMATLARPLTDPAAFEDPGVVKVVCDARGDALYFSRAPIPHFRDRSPEDAASAGAATPLAHLGVYGFRGQALQAFARLPRGRLEEAEKLEQLRALEAGWKIRVVPARSDTVGVDRPEDLCRVEQLWNARRGA